MNPNSTDDFKALVNAVKRSDQLLEPFREKRKGIIELFVGSEYKSDLAAKECYLNLIAMAVNIYVRQCAVRAPVAKITTPYNDLRPMAANFTLACQDASEETKLGRTLRRAVTDALFSPLSCVKIGLEATGKEQDVDMSNTFVELVSFDDYVRDMSTGSAYKPAFEGNRYTISLDEYKAKYPKPGLGDAQDSAGESSGSERAESLSHPQSAGEEELKGGKVTMIDIWLCEERKMVTYRYHEPGPRPLKVVDYETDEDGPYRTLLFTEVPDNAMPLPPFGLLASIHRLANSIFRRLASQAEKQKRVVGFNNEEDALKFKTCEDGDGMKWTGVKPENIEAGGIDQITLAMFIQVKDLFSWAAGNLDSLGGLSPMSDTAKQDAMLSQSASSQIEDMKDATVEFAKSIFRQIAWYEWTDPIRNRTLRKQVPGTDIVVPVKWGPETRNGNFIDFNFDIVPQSMQDNSPSLKLSKLKSVLNDVIVPMLPMMQQQGLSLDIKRLTAIIADYSNLPELEQIVIAVDPNAMGSEQQPAGDAVPKAANTHRTYERVNRPGATRVGKDAALVQTLLGGNPQKSERAAIGRSVS